MKLAKAVPTGQIIFTLFRSCLLAAVLAALPSVGQAQFTYATNGGSIAIIKYTGSSSVLTLPNITGGLPVTSIGAAAFQSSSNLTRVTIGKNMTSVGSNAFQNCASLTGAFFQGNAPSGGADTTVFSGDNNATVYYPGDATNWGATFGGRPTVGLTVIQEQPINQTAVVGGAASFSITVLGTGPFFYQWQKNGADLPGAKLSSYSVLSATTNDTGLYMVIVTNFLGSVTSSVVSLVVGMPVQTNLTVFTFAGAAGIIGSADGVGTNATFTFPCGLAMDQAGNLYLPGNNTIRQISPAGVVTTLAGLAGVCGTNDGPGSEALFCSPQSVAVNPQGNVIYVADVINDVIRKLTASGTNWLVSTFAGQPGVAGTNDGTGSVAQFNWPRSVALATNGDLYVADSNNGTIRKITPEGLVSTLAGMPGVYGSADGSSGAQFNDPRYVAVDNARNVYVADWANYTVRKITPAGVVSTLAGKAKSKGSADGLGVAARFNAPRGVAVDDAGNVYVADFFNMLIRKITPEGVVSSLAGGVIGSADGTYTNASFNQPFVVLPDGTGRTFYIVDNANHTIRKAVYDYGQPFVASEPQAYRLLVGVNFTLTPTITGSFPITYQWTFNGTNLTGANNASLMITNVQFSNSGDYGLIVANLNGASTNPIATLTVFRLPPTLTIQIVSGYPLLGLYGMLNNNFIVQYTTNSVTSNWVNLLFITNLSATPYQFLDLTVTTNRGRFYRAVMQ